VLLYLSHLLKLLCVSIACMFGVKYIDFR